MLIALVKWLLARSDWITLVLSMDTTPSILSGLLDGFGTTVVEFFLNIQESVGKGGIL